jgi:hypothetical protein
MDIRFIKSAFYEDAAGTTSTAAGTASTDIAPFKARLGDVSKRKFPETVTEETHEDVFLNEDRITYEDMPVTPFNGLDENDIKQGLTKHFQGVRKYLEYNTKNTNIDTKNIELLKKELNSIIGKVKIDTNLSLNLGDVIQMSSLISTLEDKDDFDEDPRHYLLKTASRRLEVAQRDAFECAQENEGNFPPIDEIEKIIIEALNNSDFGKVVYWQKLKSTIENFQRLNDESNN